mmetsp:Transcript_23233/g.61941  ORF Transcript_23233/g.61941 Transcript_23233/m.61941 type:complete len:211 (-) Transcript_23233:42-674(-)|eukprot:CAMPEP_0115283348 /NCGR_PEP_ID=MMETSP0270-20121206/60323_1 /TAXON_ID=71861 /ORGANISM="Scrippsiella trochoidea, Strain CCMP3099" /LENGTH=210 /DNA_ID=CAMNT_0002700245 /DNA_START=86 /DNA_END=721 /DNA_ORIENTATION=+
MPQVILADDSPGLALRQELQRRRPGQRLRRGSAQHDECAVSVPPAPDWVDVHAEDLPECGRVGAPHLRVAALLEAVAQILAPRLRVLARDVLDLYVLVDARDRAHSLDVIVGRAHVSVDDECVQVGAEASAQTIQELVGSSVDKVRLRPFPLEVVCDDVQVARHGEQGVRNGRVGGLDAVEASSSLRPLVVVPLHQEGAAALHAEGLRPS